MAAIRSGALRRAYPARGVAAGGRSGLTGWRRAANLGRVSWLPALTGRHEKGIR